MNYRGVSTVTGCLALTVAGALLLAALAGCSGTSTNAPAAGREAGRPVPVNATAAVAKAVPVEFSTFGNVEPFSTVAVKAEVNGILLKVHFLKGQDVKKGDVLFTIDPRSYQAAVDQAEANLARDQAQEANATHEEERDRSLFKTGIMPESDYGNAATALAAASAVVRADQAMLDEAKLQLEHCVIRSPIDGRVGNVLVNEGNLIKANDATLVVVNQTRPLEVFFGVPQGAFTALRPRLGKEKLEVRASIPNQEGTPEIGELTFGDNAVDATTGMVQLAATFKNDDERLWPGQYVNVVLVTDVQKDAVVLPSSCIQTGRDGKYVFVIKADNTAELRPVMVGIEHGEESVITQGVKAGETVVTDGQLRLVPGAKVEIKTGLGEAPAAGGSAGDEGPAAAKVEKPQGSAGGSATLTPTGSGRSRKAVPQGERP